MKPSRIQIDREFEDDGLYGVTFWFGEGNNPSYLSLARDQLEDPDHIYIEAEDQRYGFRVRSLAWSRRDNTIALQLDPATHHRFHWNGTSTCDITVAVAEITGVESTLAHICDPR